MEAVRIERSKRIYTKDLIIPCPVCDRTGCVNTVTSVKTSGNRVVKRKYCKECFLEFDRDGTLLPPLY